MAMQGDGGSGGRNAVPKRRGNLMLRMDKCGGEIWGVGSQPSGRDGKKMERMEEVSREM